MVHVVVNLQTGARRAVGDLDYPKLPILPPRTLGGPKGEPLPDWSRVIQKSSGTVNIKLPEGHWLGKPYYSFWMPEHRFVMSLALNRQLDGHRERVAHLDGDKTNNDIDNLFLWVALDKAQQHCPTCTCNKE